jgi:hypothetical protein
MSPGPFSIVVLGWLVPGLGHWLTGQARKAVVFFVILGGMFALGLAFQGQLFAFDTSDLLVSLAAVAQWALGAPRLVAAILGAGSGNVVAVTYEYGNTFLIVAGLLNMLVVLDAYDRASGVKRS